MICQRTLALWEIDRLLIMLSWCTIAFTPLQIMQLLPQVRLGWLAAKHARPAEVKIGDWLYLDSSPAHSPPHQVQYKLASWSGPYQVIEVSGASLRTPNCAWRPSGVEQGLQTSRPPISCLKALRSRAGPPDTSRHPISCLEALRGCAGPPDTSRHPKSFLEALRSRAGPPDDWICRRSLAKRYHIFIGTLIV